MARLTTAQHNEARIFALRVVRDPLYREKLLIFARARRLHPLIEQMLWHYAYGKPPERVELGRAGDFESLEHLSKEELAERARKLAELLLKPPTDTSDAAQQAAQAKTDLAVSRREELNTPSRIRKPGAPLRPKEIGALLEAEGFDGLGSEE